MKNKLFLSLIVFGLMMVVATPPALADNDGDVDDIQIEQQQDSNLDNQNGDNDKFETHREYLKKLQEKRQEKKEEIKEIRKQLQEKKDEIKSEAHRVNIILKEKAEFSLDDETGEVTIVTPRGEEHTLNHLPDQAIERMKATGFFEDDDLADEEELEIETNDQGEVIYHKRDKIRKKLFGLFPREIESEIILNDATGEVTEHELTANSFWVRVLNWVSF